MQEYRFPHICCNCVERQPRHTWKIYAPTESQSTGYQQYAQVTKMIDVPVCDNCLEQLVIAERYRWVILGTASVLGGATAAIVLWMMVFLKGPPEENILLALIFGAIPGALGAFLLSYWPVSSYASRSQPASFRHGILEFHSKKYQDLYLDANYWSIHSISLTGLQAIATVGTCDDIYFTINGQRIGDTPPFKQSLFTINRGQPLVREFGGSNSDSQAVNYDICRDQAPGYAFDLALFRCEEEGKDRLLGNIQGKIDQDLNKPVLVLSVGMDRGKVAREGPKYIVMLECPTGGVYKLSFEFASLS